MDTKQRVIQLAEERNLSLYQLSALCQIPESTLRSAHSRRGQFGVDTIERICLGLNITMAEFFDTPLDNYCITNIQHPPEGENMVRR